MKSIIQNLVLLTVGAAAGVSIMAQMRPASRIQVQSMELVDEAGHVVARIASESGRSALTFLNPDGSKSVEVGVDKRFGHQFLLFHSTGNRTVASLISRGPDHQATLYLGDDNWVGRATIGSLAYEQDDGRDEGLPWGITFKGSNSSQILYGMQLRGPGGKDTSMHVVKKDGSVWSVGETEAPIRQLR